MRDLHPGHDHGGGRSADREPLADTRGGSGLALRQPLSLHRLHEDPRRGGPRRAVPARRPGPASRHRRDGPGGGPGGRRGEGAGDGGLRRRLPAAGLSAPADRAQPPRLRRALGHRHRPRARRARRRGGPDRGRRSGAERLRHHRGGPAGLLRHRACATSATRWRRWSPRAGRRPRPAPAPSASTIRHSSRSCRPMPRGAPTRRRSTRAGTCWRGRWCARATSPAASSRRRPSSRGRGRPSGSSTRTSSPRPASATGRRMARSRWWSRRRRRTWTGTRRPRSSVSRPSACG